MTESYDPTAHIDNAWSRANRSVVLGEMQNDESNPRCANCHEQRRLLPMPGYAWGWESLHEPHCPESDDNREAVEAQIVGIGDFHVAMQAEAIWEASQHADEEAGE